MGIPFEVIYAIAAIALLLGLIYAVISYNTRNRKRDAETEAATRELYKTPTRDDDASQGGGKGPPP